MSWKPITPSHLKEAIEQKLKEITAAIAQKVALQNKNYSLMGGSIGEALYLFYYANHSLDNKDLELATEMAYESFENIQQGPVYHSFSGGLAGMGWFFEHLTQNDIIEGNINEALEQIDDFLYQTMMEEIAQKNFDYLHGALGNGLYFLKRNNDKANQYLSELIHKLKKISIQDKKGIKWESVIDHEKGTKGYNLSLSHGISSIIAILGKAYEKGIEKEKSKHLMDGALNWLFNQKLQEGALSHFPNYIIEHEDPGISRLAWCYGDLGMGIALWLTAQRIKNSELAKKSMEILTKTTKRKDLKENMVFDAGLCHGSAGIMHIYNRMYHYTGKREFKETALYWLDKVLKMARFDDGFAGFKSYSPVSEDNWKNNASFLEGIAGIGLALLAMISDIEPTWDECLLLS